jgi:hypothetical protein
MKYVKSVEHYQCQTIYATNQDKKDMGCVVVFLILKHFFVHVAKQSLEQSLGAKEYGINRMQKVYFVNNYAKGLVS